MKGVAAVAQQLRQGTHWSDSCWSV